VSDDIGADDDLDRGSFLGRAGRYAKVTGTMGGLAAKMAGQKYLGRNIDKPEHARALTAALGNLKGPLLKVAQLLVTIPQALPPEYAAELQQLQADAPPMGWPFVKRRMRAELGPDWQSHFTDFTKEAVAAASLGQVHRGTTTDGQDVACKLQYPDMESAVKSDLSQLKLILSIFARYDKAIDTREIYQEITERLFEELDYKREAKQTKLYDYMLRNEPGVHIPQVVDELSTGRLLTASWQNGARILTFKDADSDVRAAIALNMFRAWYVPLCEYGIIHGDPHLGNYTVRPDHSLNLLDFGCVRIFPPRFVKGVVELYRALRDNDDARAVYAYECWGFEDISKDLLDVLNVWARFLYGPILEDKIRPIGELQEGGGVYGRDTAEKVHMELRRVGGVTVPREFVFMDRAALGLGSVFLHLRAEVNWFQVFNALIDDFDVDKLAAKQAEALERFDLSG
tara:strand:- start:3952 stop:5319 length:1368 start_codon:yes stop_codon:yes gene_type:complete